MTTETAQPPFAGWPPEALTFFQALARDNSKTFFAAHRAVYEQAVRGPLLALVAALEPEFGAGKLFRPYRDIRFSQDKSPYHTHISASLGDPGTPARYYVRFSADGLFVAAGAHALDRPRLERYRAAVAAPATGAALAGIVAALEAAGYSVGEETLKRVPAGYPADHPQARLLRFTGLTMARAFLPAPWLQTPAAQDHVVAVWRAAGPLLGWLRAAVG